MARTADFIDSVLVPLSLKEKNANVLISGHGAMKSDKNNDYNTDTAHWYYANKDGSLKTNEFAKINGKYYAFNENSEMVAGL